MRSVVFIPKLCCAACMILVVAFLQWYVSSLGFGAVAIESFMGLPQLLRNFKRKDTSGVSIVMVLGWVGGDIMKVWHL